MKNGRTLINGWSTTLLTRYFPKAACLLVSLKVFTQGGGSSVASDLSLNDRAVHVDFFNGMLCAHTPNLLY